jgi:hypothetical protein
MEIKIWFRVHRLMNFMLRHLVEIKRQMCTCNPHMYNRDSACCKVAFSLRLKINAAQCFILSVQITNIISVLALKLSFHELSLCPIHLYIFILFSETPDCVIDHTQGQAVEPLPAERQQEGEEVCSIQAHRVIVAARCDWFRRALLSGMREAIDR